MCTNFDFRYCSILREKRDRTAKMATNSRFCGFLQILGEKSEGGAAVALNTIRCNVGADKNDISRSDNLSRRGLSSCVTLCRKKWDMQICFFHPRRSGASALVFAYDSDISTSHTSRRDGTLREHRARARETVTFSHLPLDTRAAQEKIRRGVVKRAVAS